jgi:hypothetical protein
MEDESDFVGGKLAVKDIKRFINSAQFKKNKTVPDADISGYRYDPSLSTNESVVYYSPTLNHAVHSIRATNGTVKDWINNGIYLASPLAYRQTPRYKNAINTQTQMEQRYPDAKKSIVTHSQSGIIGRYMARDRPNTEVIQLNPASSWKDNTVNDNDPNVYTIKSTKDLVSSFHKNKPQDIIIPGESLNQVKEHDIDVLDRLPSEQMVGFGKETPIFRIKLSDLPTKKYAVTYRNPSTGKDNTINFGARGYTDFTQPGTSENKKRLYLIRHRNDPDDDITTAGTWAKWLLWNHRNIDDSLKDIEKHFGIEVLLG